MQKFLLVKWCQNFFAIDENLNEYRCDTSKIHANDSVPVGADGDENVEVRRWEHLVTLILNK